jgi:cell wall-associated NlpC family hydrolase
MRDCLREFGIDLPNFARPERFWEDPRLDLYAPFWDYGFRPVEDKPMGFGDVLLMPIRTPINTHAGLLVNTNQILHHPPGRLSCIDNLRPHWLPRVMTVLRHPVLLEAFSPVETTQHFHEALPDAVILRTPGTQEQIAAVLAARD